MFTVRLRTFHFGLMLATALAVSTWASEGQAYSPDQEQACSGDAFRLCSADIPDVDRVKACMVRNQSQLSPDCRAFFRSSWPAAEPAVTRVTARRPLSIRPAAAKPRKSKKPKKPKKSVRT